MRVYGVGIYKCRGVKIMRSIFSAYLYMVLLVGLRYLLIKGCLLFNIVKYRLYMYSLGMMVEMKVAIKERKEAYTPLNLTYKRRFMFILTNVKLSLLIYLSLCYVKVDLHKLV